MARIIRTPENLFPFPQGAFVVNRRYVYINTGGTYVPSDKEKGIRGHTNHTTKCIGAVQDPDDMNCRMFYANNEYREALLSGPESPEKSAEYELPDPPMFADSLSVGIKEFIRKAGSDSGLTPLLSEVFGSEDAAQVLDLAYYMMSKESAVMQHFPAWARDHTIFSETIRNDTYLGLFLKKRLTISKIGKFRKEWLKRNLESGYIYLCYDSTNVNSQADGVFIVQRGHAKDNPDLKQVNTDYVIRQEDGLPLTYLHSPGSVSDIAQAQEMIRLIKDTSALTGTDTHLCLICDRGYISQKNLQLMEKADINYLLMLRSDLKLYKSLADQYIDTVRSYKNLLVTGDSEELYGITVPCDLYSDGSSNYAHVYWSPMIYSSRRKAIMDRIDGERTLVDEFIKASQGQSFEEKELDKRFPEYFKLTLEPGTPKIEIQKKRGRGSGTKEVKKDTVIVTGYKEDEDAINREIMKAGIIVMVSRDQMTAQEAEDRYHKRDCVEKAFEALKSHLGMDKIGVTTEEAMHGKGFIWFVASILHALMFNKTERLRAEDKKHYTTEAMIDQLEAIKADKDLSTGAYQRRYKLTRRQLNILSCIGSDEAEIDELIASI